MKKNEFIQHIFKYLILFALAFGLQPTKVFAQTNEETFRKMLDDAEKCVKNYVYGLNQIGKPESENPFKLQDIDNCLKNYFENSNVRVYNDITRVKDNTNPNFSAREYLEKVMNWYTKGVEFKYNLAKPEDPCKQTDPNGDYYLVRVKVAKELKGQYDIDDGVLQNSDSLDIFIKFPIKQNRPYLVVDLARIANIEAHDPSYKCVEKKDNNAITIIEFEEFILKKRAEAFVKDYSITLNVIGNPTLNERYETTDYFEFINTPVYNDIFPTILKEEFTADDYLRYIELWYQEGIVFDYSEVKATSILTRPDHVSVEVEVNRTIRVPAKNYRDRQVISIFVKFPIDPKSKKLALYPDNRQPSVGLERATPRIYKIEKKRVRTNPKNYLAVGLQLNVANYFGDLNPMDRFLSTELRFTRPSFAFQITKKLSPYLYLRGSLSFAWLAGDDFTSAKSNDGLAKYRYIRNAHFRNRITELAVVGIYDLKPNRGLYYRRRFVTPYVFAGIGLIYHNPQAKTPAEFGANWVDLQPLRTEGQGKEGNPRPYSRIQPVIPFGLGAKFRLTNRIDIGWELGIRLTFTDYLDDVSGTYVNPWELDSELAQRMANRTLEPFAQYSGGNRTAEVDRLLREFGGGDPLSIRDPNNPNNTYTTFNGYGRRGDQRGNASSKDYYVFTGFRLTYLLKVGEPPSGKQKPKFRLDFDN
ncbi:MAG: hypothetical protein MUE85_07755 [Microscillaceae bacterium]|jgi:hypothetical protein|nr:hypothetical protein [Microscillaceae bacterium]